MLPSCALLGGFAIGAWVALLWQHNANTKCCLPYILAYKSKNLGQFCPLKIRGSTYTLVTVCQHMCHEFFHEEHDVS